MSIKKDKNDNYQLIFNGFVYEASDETNKYYLCDVLSDKIFKFLMSFSNLLFKSKEVNFRDRGLKKDDFIEFFKVNKRQEKQYEYLKTGPYSKYVYQDRDYGVYYYIPLKDIFPKDISKRLKEIKSKDPYMAGQVPALLRIINGSNLKLIGGSKNDKGFLCLDAPALPEVKYKCSGAAINVNNDLLVPFLDVKNNYPVSITRYSSQISKSIIHEIRHLYDGIIGKLDMSENLPQEGDTYEDYLMKPSERNAHFETMAKEIEKYIVYRIKDVNKLYNSVIRPDEKYGPRERIKEDPYDYNQYVEQRNYLIDLLTSRNSFLKFLEEHYINVFSDMSSYNFYVASKKNDKNYNELIGKISEIVDDLLAKYKNVIPTKKYEKVMSRYYDEENKATS